MRILYLHQYFATPSMSGGTRSYEFARRLVSSGHEVHMITSHRESINNEKIYKENIDGIDVYWLSVPYSNSFGYLRRIFAFTKFIVLSSVLALKIKCDVVFATSTPLTIAIPAIIYSKLKYVPMVFEVRDLWPELPIAIGALKSGILIRIAKILEKTAYFHSKYVIALSPGMKKGIEKTGYPKVKIKVIPNSCDIERFDVPRTEGANFRNTHNWIGNRKLVVYAGTFGLINDVTYFVHLAKEMIKLDENVVFLAVGDGSEKEKLYDIANKEGVLNNKFFILPPIKKEMMPELLSAATLCTSLFIPLTEMWNNSANKFFDALAAGKPVMINYGGWQAKILHETGAGIVAPPNDPFKAAYILNEFISNDVKLKEAAIAAKKLAYEKFNGELLYQQFETTLNDAVS